VEEGGGKKKIKKGKKNPAPFGKGTFPGKKKRRDQGGGERELFPKSNFTILLQEDTAKSCTIQAESPMKKRGKEKGGGKRARTAVRLSRQKGGKKGKGRKRGLGLARPPKAYLILSKKGRKKKGGQGTERAQNPRARQYEDCSG